jgi:hypothetical protein
MKEHIPKNAISRQDSHDPKSPIRPFYVSCCFAKSDTRKEQKAQSMEGIAVLLFACYCK